MNRNRHRSTYGWDSVGRLTNVTSGAGSFGYHYHAQRSTLVSQLALPGGAYITNTVDAIARLTETRTANHAPTPRCL